MAFKDSLLESPVSLEKYDQVLEMPVKYFTSTTTYTQFFNLKKDEEFSTLGKVEFLVEPECVPYHVFFRLANQQGKLVLEQTKIITAPNYHGPFKIKD